MPLLRIAMSSCIRSRKMCWRTRALGGTDAFVEISDGDDWSSTLRRGKIETIEQNKDKGMG